MVMCLSRRRWHVADVALLAGLALLAAESVLAGQVLSATEPAPMFESESWRLTLLSVVPGTWMLFALRYARGAARPRRRAAVASLAIPLVGGLLLRDQFLHGLAEPLTPGDRPLLVVSWWGFVLFIWLVIGCVAVLMDLERTFRASIGVIRWRIKFVLLGVGLIFIARLYTASQVLLQRGIDVPLELVNAIALIVATPLLAVGLHRDRGQPSEVYPSRSILQSSMTVLFAGVYLLVVGVFAKIVAYLGGGESIASKAFLVLVGIVIIGAVLQSDRARVQFRRVLSRYFQRPLHDYRSIWRQFTECSATKVEQGDLTRSMTRLVAEAFDALSVSLWLLDDHRQELQLSASTFLPETDDGTKEAHRPPALADALAYFSAHPEPVDIDSTRFPWATEFHTLHPLKFSNGGHRIVTALTGRNGVLGFLIVGDRVGGAPFEAQDLDLLKSIGDHISGSLLNLQLSQRLLETKELQAFQTMATFFVHDLKNATSTLSLMLKNLPVHFDDPEFRQDALRGIGKTVNHINSLISRLSLLRGELRLKQSRTDVNRLVEQVLQQLDATTRQQVEWSPAAPVFADLDGEQIQKVLLNLLLNAREALPNGRGQIRVQTEASDQWAVIRVIDNGSGMSPEFLRSGLFKPFQTTKKQGLGIGMFQSKMIIEAHGGRIGAVSEASKGTTFEVRLPVVMSPALSSTAAPAIAGT